MKRLVLAGVSAALLVAASAPSASGAVTIGQLAPSPGSIGTCNVEADRLQLTVNSGNSYVVPSTGGITQWVVKSWSNVADSGGEMTMKIYRHVSATTYSVVGHDGPRALTPSALNTFPASFVVRPGDILGLNTSGGTGCIFSAPGELYLARAGNLGDGQSGSFTSGAPVAPDTRLNITAVLDPANAFSITRITRNKKKGRATIDVDLPNPGDLTASGKGVKASGAAVKSVPAPAGDADLTLRAKGKQKAKLNDTGKVKLNAKITFTPNGGTPFTVTRKVKLKKNV